MNLPPFSAVGLTTLLIAASFLADAAQADDLNCRRLYRLTDLSHAVEPGAIVPRNGAVPAHCRVRGVINRAIRFEVTLPIEGWNGRLMFSTVGGRAGSIGDTTSLLHRGFAMASTDTGHDASEGNAFFAHPEASLDFAFRGVHLATAAAKSVIVHFYGSEIRFAYLQGCSNGGRAAMLEAVRFPEDYDGILAGAPGFRQQEYYSWMISVARAQRANPLTRDALLVLHEGSRSACDALDGVEDGVIDDPRRCTEDVYDVGALECKPGESHGCLTPGQVETARFIYRDQLGPDGTVLSRGVEPGAEAAGDWAYWLLPNERYGGGTPLGDILPRLQIIMKDVPGFEVDTFDPVSQRALLDDKTSAADVRSADLSEFEARGGRLLMYQGWNDFPLRAERAIDFLAEVEAEMGGRDRTAGFFRLFMVPGMTHCTNGPGPWQADWVTALVAWRERGEAPDRITGRSGNVPVFYLSPDERAEQKLRFSRPLCPYPQTARYRGQGDRTDSESYDCASP